MTLPEWQDNLGLRLGDPGFQGIKLFGGLACTRPLITSILNQARRIVSQKTLCFQRTSTLDLVAGTDKYVFPTDFEFLAARPGDISFYTNSDGTYATLHEMSWSDYLSRKSTATSNQSPCHIFFRKSDGYVYISPAPSVAQTAGVTLVARCLVPTFIEGNPNPIDGIPEQYQELVYAKVISLLHPDKQTRAEQMALYEQGWRQAVKELAREREALGVPEIDTDWGLP